MHCDDIRILISRDIDGELSSREADALREHLASCTVCAEYSEQARRLDTVLQRSTVESPESGYWDGLVLRAAGAAAGETEQLERKTKLYRIAAVLSGAAAVVLLVCLLTTKAAPAVATSQGRNADPLPVAAGQYDLAAIARKVNLETPIPISEQAAAFRVLADYFQGGVTWMAQDGAQAEMGVSGAAGGAVVTSAKELTVAHMRLLRSGPDGRVELLSAPTLMLCEGQEASFRLAATDGRWPNRFRYRCTMAGDGAGARLTVEVLAAAADNQAAVHLAGVVAPNGGTPQPVAFSATPDGGYLLLVAVRQPKKMTDIATQS